jgi:phospholipase C
LENNQRLTFGLIAIAVAALALASCATGSPPASESGVSAALPASGSGGSTPISHIVIIVQENRSFDDFFSTFPNADGTTQGLMKTSSGDQYVPLKEVDLNESCDFRHSYNQYTRDLDGGKMDGFNLEGGSGKCPGRALAPYQYVNPSEIAPYWDMAKQYVLADHLFQTQGSGSFTGHQDLIRGDTVINKNQTKSLVNIPTGAPWGCDAPHGTRTSLIVDVGSQVEFKKNKGPFPCLTYETLRDLLDAKYVSWKYYSPPVQGGPGAIWNAFDAIKAVRYGPEWGVNVTDSNTAIFSDITGGTLPNVSWVIPDRINSDHPASGSDTGPSWVASLVNAIGESSYWQTSAIIVVWDDWGGFYDHVPPTLQDKWGGLGFRVPAIVISPYAYGGTSTDPYVSHTPYEFGSILRFVEETFGLGSLGTTDQRATSLGNTLNFSGTPRPFSAIPSKYSRSFFEHQHPSGLPVDTE